MPEVASRVCLVLYRLVGTALYGRAKFSAKPKMKSVSFLYVYNLKFYSDILKKKSLLEITD